MKGRRGKKVAGGAASRNHRTTRLEEQPAPEGRKKRPDHQSHCSSNSSHRRRGRRPPFHELSHRGIHAPRTGFRPKPRLAMFRGEHQMVMQRGVGRRHSGRFSRPLRGATISCRHRPVVPLRSTTGYLLSSLRDVPDHGPQYAKRIDGAGVVKPRTTLLHKFSSTTPATATRLPRVRAGWDGRPR